MSLENNGYGAEIDLATIERNAEIAHSKDQLHALGQSVENQYSDIPEHAFVYLVQNCEANLPRAIAEVRSLLAEDSHALDCPSSGRLALWCVET